MHYLIGIDLGTSGTKTVLFDETGRTVASATAEYPLHQPQNGWAEQAPADWWAACITTLRQVLAQSGVPPTSIAGIGISGQMHGLVLLGEDGEVLRGSILWCDGRTTAQCAEVTRRVGAQRLIELCANPALPGFTAGKVLWVRENEPELYKKVRHILLPKDYLHYKLTGVFATEASDASGTNLMDIRTRQWSPEILEALGIEENLLPPIRGSAEVTGHITTEAAALTGLSEGTPVVGGAGDNAAAAVGTGVVECGKAMNTLGTSGVLYAHMDTPAIDPEGRVHTFCSAVPGGWAAMSCTLSAGGSLKWFRDQFCAEEVTTAKARGIDVYQLLDEMAGEIPIGAERLLFLPYLMGERSPLLDEAARGVFFGLSGIHSRAHLLRAVLEGVVYSQRQCLDVLQGMGVPFGEVIATGGGGTSPLWRQMLADVLALPVATVKAKEGPALGAAILAGVGAGVYQSIPAACQTLVQTQTAQPPKAENTARYLPYYTLYKGLYPALSTSFKDLNAL